MYTRLYEYRREVVARYEAAGRFVRDLGAIGERHVIERALRHPQLLVEVNGKRAMRPEADIRHALDMLGAQADEKARAGEDPAWSLLASAWSPEVLFLALQCPDEKTARQRAVRRTRRSCATAPTSHPPNSHEYFAELARRQKEASDAARDPAE